MTAEEILAKSKLLTEANCRIIEGVVYERLSDAHLDKFFSSNCDIFRFFFTVDHYDYVEPGSMLHETLERHFK